MMHSKLMKSTKFKIKIRLLNLTAFFLISGTLNIGNANADIDIKVPPVREPVGDGPSSAPIDGLLGNWSTQADQTGCVIQTRVAQHKNWFGVIIHDQGDVNISLSPACKSLPITLPALVNVICENQQTTYHFYDPTQPGGMGSKQIYNTVCEAYFGPGQLVLTQDQDSSLGHQLTVNILDYYTGYTNILPNQGPFSQSN